MEARIKLGLLKAARRRLNVLTICQHEPPKHNRYATVKIQPLNGGAGEVCKNFKTRTEFESFYRSIWRGGEDVPRRGVGAIGNGIIGYQWKIFARTVPADYGVCC